jgi:hypothetical protein
MTTAGNQESPGFIRGEDVKVITLIDDGVTYGVNAWRSNNTDIRRYGEEPG